MDRLVFTDHPVVVLATNTFIDVPIVLQYEDTPLIEVVRLQQAGYTTRIPIYHSDGTQLANVVGSQMYLTEDGKKAGIHLEHPDKMTVCRQGERVIFEIRRTDAASLRTQAELYCPDGYFVKYGLSHQPSIMDNLGNALTIGGITFEGNTFMGCRIGIWVKRNGISMGVGQQDRIR